MKKGLFLVLLGWVYATQADEPINEVTCDIEGKVTQLFFDGRSDAEGVLPTGELIVARSIQWSDSDIPALSTLEAIEMEVKFPFRLAGAQLDCEVYHPSRWWFNSPRFMEVLRRHAPDKSES